MECIAKKINHSLIVLLTLILTSQSTFAEKSVNLKGLSLQDVASIAIAMSLADQVKETNEYYLAGEWTSQVSSSPGPFVVGVGKMFGSDEEATAFTTGSVINVLAQTYLDHPELHENVVMKQIPLAVSRGVETFARYKGKNAFNFYPEKIGKKGVVVRRPVDMRTLPIWHGFTNIPDDADTTSVTNSALLLNSKINNTNYTVPEETLALFSQFRDLDRKPHYYNRREKAIDTGAFMTWLYDEKDPKMPRFIFAASEKGERIPFNVNDVDCVVNANVIKMLALSKRSDILGYKESCEMMNVMIEKDLHHRCGIYYPNTMNLSFVLALASKAGDQCLLDSSKNLVVDKILNSQSSDGAWINARNLYSDPVITTAFAMYSLMQFGDVKDQKVSMALKNGTKFLLTETRLNKKNGQMYWPEEHFFTAAAIARSMIMWRAKGYTNATVGSVLLEMATLYPELSAQDYLDAKYEK